MGERSDKIICLKTLATLPARALHRHCNVVVEGHGVKDVVAVRVPRQRFLALGSSVVVSHERVGRVFSEREAVSVTEVIFET